MNSRPYSFCCVVLFCLVSIGQLIAYAGKHYGSGQKTDQGLSCGICQSVSRMKNWQSIFKANGQGFM